MKAAQIIKEWRENPVKFAWDNFKFEPDQWQKEALEVFPSQDENKKRISLQACAGPGKSALLAVLGWNFLACYGTQGEHPKGAAISITYDNLRDNLWPEFSKWQQRSEFLKRAFTWQKERIFANDHPETWFISARSWSKTANADEQGRTLSGLHSKYILFLIDESGEIPVSLLKSAEQAVGTRGTWAKILQAGNPTSLSGMLYAAATSLRHLWYVIRITGDPDDPRRSPRIDIEWARNQIHTYGRDNPWVMSYILGLFPPSSVNTLLGPEEVEAAMRRHYKPAEYERVQKRLGIDVARFGDDRTTLCPRQGLVWFRPVEMRNADGPTVASRAALAKERWDWNRVSVDDTGGYGSSVIDSLKLAGFDPVAVNFSSKADDERYFNKRAEMWFRMAQHVKSGASLPNIPQLLRELTTPRYYYQNGKFRLEDKDQIKKRLQFSPDLADGYAVTFDIPDMPAVNPLDELYLQTYVHSQQKTLTDWDPMQSR